MARVVEAEAVPGRTGLTRVPRVVSVSPIRRLWAFHWLSTGQIALRCVFLALVVILLAVGLLATAKAVTWIDKHFAGVLFNERMVPGNVGRYEWSGTAAGLKYPNKVVRANGVEVRSMRDLEAVLAQVDVGTPIVYTIQRGGRLVDLTVHTMRFTWTDLLVTFGLFLAAGVTYLVIGSVVFILKPDTEVSVAFLFTCFWLSAFTIVAFDVFSTHSGFVRLYMLANAFMPACFIHLSLVFPERSRIVRRQPFVRFVPYAISVALAIPYQLLYPRPRFLVFSRLAVAYAILSAIAMTVSTLSAYFKSPSAIARQRAKVILAGAAVALPIPALGRYLSLFGGDVVDAIIQNNFLVVLLVLFPASIAYAIVKHNLFDVDVYIKRAVGYGIMTAVVGVTYFSMQTVLSTFVLGPVFGEYRETVYPIVFALLIVLFFNPLNRKVQESVDRIFFRGKLDYKETVGAVSNALTSLLNLDQIVKQVVHTVRKQMFVDAAGVIVLESQKNTCQAFLVSDAPKTLGDTLHELPVAYDDPLLALVREEKRLITKYEIEEDVRYGAIRDPCLASFSALTASLAIPLISQGEVTGLLAVGHKKSGHFYSREDIDLLNTMANQAAVAIQNATAHEEVVRYAEELAASLRRIQILESIKTNLAKFVPRTVQELIEESPEAPSLDKREADVSVVFADITGYTRLSAQLELDQVNRLVERYFGAFLDEILKYGGDVNETAGDGLMVIFRDPDPHQHARAAVRAALGIQRRTREINAQLRGQFEPITMHVGVNSGIASVGATKIEGAAGTRWTYTASGPTTNIAARLAALGEGGAVVLSEGTRRRLGDEFELKDLGLQSLKNVETPIRVYRLTGEPREPVSGGVD